MIHVCSLARLPATVEETRAQHVVTLLKQIELVPRRSAIPRGNHLHVGIDDIAEPLDGQIHPAEEHVVRLIEFVQQWRPVTPAGGALLCRHQPLDGGRLHYRLRAAAGARRGRRRQSDPRRLADRLSQPAAGHRWPTASLAAAGA